MSCNTYTQYATCCITHVILVRAGDANCVRLPLQPHVAWHGTAKAYEPGKSVQTFIAQAASAHIASAASPVLSLFKDPTSENIVLKPDGSFRGFESGLLLQSPDPSPASQSSICHITAATLLSGFSFTHLNYAELRATGWRL